MASAGIVLGLFGLILFGGGSFLTINILTHAQQNWAGVICPLILFIPMCLAGIGLAMLPLWLRWRSKQTVYALTNRRALIMEPSSFGAMLTTSYTASGLGHLTLREFANGSGDVLFLMDRTGGTYDRPYYFRVAGRGFLAIENARVVERLIRQTLLSGSDS
jgi:hypothetical protein